MLSMSLNSNDRLTLFEIAALVQREHQQCKALPTLGLLHARNAGEWLLAAKAVLSEGQWQTWLTVECQLVEQTAHTYMAIAKSWPSLEQPQIRINLDSSPSVGVEVESVREAEAEISAIQPLESREIESAIATVEVVETVTEEALESDRFITIFIPGAVVPKARPRVTANGTYFPKRYQEWRSRAEGEIILQLARKNLNLNLPLEKAIVEVHLIGKHRTNADGDNIVGSCLDALVSAGAIKNDNLSYIPEIYFKFVPQGSQGVQIILIPLD